MDNFTFLNSIFRIDNQLYCCYISQQELPDDVTFKFIESHQSGKTNRDVLCLMFVDCTITKIPKGLTKIFPNLRILNIQESKLKIITKEDLAEYKNLEKLMLEENEIEFLSGDLFDGFKNLKSISFRKNKLLVIEPNLLDGLDKLEAVNFRDNTSFDMYYSMLADEGSNASLVEVKDQIFEEFFKSNLFFQKNFIKKCQQKIQDLSKNDRIIQQVEDQIKAAELRFKEKANREIRELRRTNEQLLNSLQQEKTEKAQLAEDVFAQLGALNINQPGASCSHWDQPQGGQNIFSTDDLIEILRISNKHDYIALSLKAFGEIKRRYPRIEFLEEWAMDADKVEETIGLHGNQSKSWGKSC